MPLYNIPQHPPAASHVEKEKSRCAMKTAYAHVGIYLRQSYRAFACLESHEYPQP
jgi:hypothetical protein